MYPHYPDENTPTNTTRNNLRLTKEGVNYLVLSKTNKASGRILPSFDFSLNPKDEAFKTSFVPYRDNNRLSDQGIPMFRSWFFYFDMYTYLGKSRHFFVSPEVRKQFNPGISAAESFDPVKTMFWKIRRNDTQHMHLRNLVMKPANNTEVVNLPLAAPKRCAVMNFYGHVDPKNEYINTLLVMSETGMGMMKDLLDEAGLRSQAPRDMQWQDFLFGDVTHPETGLRADHAVKVATSNNERGIGVNTMAFSSGDKTLQGSAVVPIGAQALAGRYNFFDIDAVWNIPSAQEIVDRLVEDNEIPLEFMKEICGNFCDFPERAPVSYDSQSTSFAPPQQHESPEIPAAFVAQAAYQPPVQQAYQPPVQQAYQPPVTQAPAPQQSYVAPAPQPAAVVGAPPAEETDKQFAERIDREVEALKATDPAIHFVSYLKDNAAIVRYMNGKQA
jgi:hypothetical protein